MGGIGVISNIGRKKILWEKSNNLISTSPAW
jgi:hypothetical protein